MSSPSSPIADSSSHVAAAAATTPSSKITRKRKTVEDHYDEFKTLCTDAEIDLDSQTCIKDDFESFLTKYASLNNVPLKRFGQILCALIKANVTTKTDESNSSSSRKLSKTSPSTPTTSSTSASKPSSSSSPDDDDSGDVKTQRHRWTADEDAKVHLATESDAIDTLAQELSMSADAIKRRQKLLIKKAADEAIMKAFVWTDMLETKLLREYENGTKMSDIARDLGIPTGAALSHAKILKKKKVSQE